MSRTKIKVGEACRYGHPWNRGPDGRKCLTCYAPAGNRLRHPESKTLLESKLALREIQQQAKFAAAALKKERLEANAAEIKARLESKARRLADLLAAREVSAARCRERIAKREEEREKRKQLKEEREKHWEEKRRALTKAEQKDRARRARRKRGAPWLRQSGYRAELWAEQQGRCGLTGAPIPSDVVPQLDHIVAKSKGGATVKSNLQWVHPMANHAKNSHTVEEFRTWLLEAAEALKQKMQLEELL